MKISAFIFTLIIAVPCSAFSQQNEYEITSFREDGALAPNTHYIGSAWLQGLLRADDESKINITKAKFKANSTLDWHKHETPQILIYIEGQGYYQEKGKAPVILKAGDIIKCKADVEHWHASTKTSDVTYLALYGGSQPTTWTQVLTQEYYDSVAKQLNQ
jgi:quercetin dioxygenase-like cupin family protein